MYINRFVEKDIKKRIDDYSKLIVIYGPRQVGKTTLVKQVLKSYKGRVLEINADEDRYIDVLSSKDSSKLKSLTSGYDLLFIDEAQRVPDIGLTLKIIHDQLNIKLIVTGSASLSLANNIQEPLTGRYWQYTLYPLSFVELNKYYNKFELNSSLEDRMIFGSYPEIFNIDNHFDKEEYLRLITRSYLYKDVLELETIKYPRKIVDLLRLLAFQVGSEVSYSELAKNLEMSKGTVQNYIDLLEKSFVIFRLSGFSRNLRKEITKNDKIYFYDLGVRNALIDNFNSLVKRNDVGGLWENFIIVERIKRNLSKQLSVASYFWRVYTGAEIDYLEETNSKLAGFEIKYIKEQVSKPQTFLETYPDSEFNLINKTNYLNFIL
ncbi:MAG: ATP-binding protein [bacterium]|nr:ATP-binding protein [bacterium]